jgi:fibronectin type 3 domain-containing protein
VSRRGSGSAAAIAGGLAVAAFGFASHGAAQQGSNLGGYGTPYQTPAITGIVASDSGAPVAGASVSTPDGHVAATDAAGAFTLRVDVPGLYHLSVASGAAVVGPVEVSVPEGGNATRNFVLPSSGPTGPVPLRFDFGTASSPLEAGYARVGNGTAYSGASGFGWGSGTISSRNRGTGSNLARDFDFCTSCTFLVDVPTGDYVVKLLVGDTSGPHDQMRFAAEGAVLDTISTTAGPVVARSYRVTVADGQLSLAISDQGGADANAVINALEVVPLWPRRYDLGTASSPVLTGAFRVTGATAYDPAHGYGWLSGTRGSADRASGDDAERDFDFTAHGSLAVDLPEGLYVVSVLMGDPTAAHEQMGVSLEGATFDSVSTTAGSYTRRSYTVAVSDGQLTLELEDLGGPDGDVVLNGLQVAQAQPLMLDFGTASSPVAAGWARARAGLAYDPARGYGWSAGMIQERDRGGANALTRDLDFTPDGTFRIDLANGAYDVTLTVGDGATAHDAIAVFLEGVQRDTLSPAKKEFLERSYRVVVTDGDLLLRLKDQGGSDPNAVVNALAVVPAGAFRLDFGTATSPLENGYTRVTEASAYTAAAGFGWTSGVLASRDRGSETALRRDLIFTPLGTFAVDLADGIYDVALVMGDRTAAHDQMGVSLEGAQVAAPGTAAGQFTEVRARVKVDDGQLTVGLHDLGGADANVVVNSLAVDRVDAFDFGTATSPVAPGFVRVAADAFSAAAGYGWTAGTVTVRDRGIGSALTRDFNFTPLGTFESACPNGVVLVTVVLGDATAAHDAMGVYLEGALVDTITTAAGEATARTFRATVGDSRLTVKLDDLGGADANAVIDALLIRPD